MPQSIPAALTRTHVLQAIADLDAGVDHAFGQPTGYELLHEGKRYPPKDHPLFTGLSVFTHEVTACSVEAHPSSTMP